MVDGILNIDKPFGRTSFSIVGMVRRLSGEKRVGHAGTLDPAATGVLPICLGQATRVTEFFHDMPKVYRAEIELGTSTDTYDATGRIVQQGDLSQITRTQLESALSHFRGEIEQIPPMYSAAKHQGKPLYKLARAGVSVERKSRPAKIYNLELLDFELPLVKIEVTCGKGVYIRSLAHDLGQALGCGAHLKSLIRLKYGNFDIDNAITISQLEDAFSYGYWQNFIHPVDSVLLDWTAMVLSENTELDIKNGCLSDLKSPMAANRCRAYDTDGHFWGVLRFSPEKSQWLPGKILKS
ncbi:MAG: tRNA pseudouridine(55) synthase TruB [Chloroflexota bacterium]